VPLYDQRFPIVGDEWERFKRGAGQIGDAAGGREPDKRGPRPGPTDTGNRITVPGWDDVIRLGPRTRPTTPELDEYYAAKRAGRQPNISPEARQGIEEYRAYKENARNSAQPEWSKGWGSILTAIDNVQDFVSTMATLGRLALWAGPRAAVGLEALLGLEGALTAGAAARLGGRFVPILGGVILAGDILNLAALLGLLGMAGFGVVCAGPSAALAAGAPMLLLKRGLKQEVWNAARRNPFGRLARLDARGRAVGKLPGIGNLIEVAQTTEQLFGYGLSFGAVMAFMGEGAFAVERAARGQWPTINLEGARKSWERLGGKISRVMQPQELKVYHDAVRVVETAPVIMSGQDPFDEETHLIATAAYLLALPLVMEFFDRMPWEDLLEEMLATPMYPRLELGPVFGRIVAEEGPPLWTGDRFVLPGSPGWLYPADYIEQMSPRIAAAVRRFIERRRDGVPALIMGTMIGQATETVWRHFTRSDTGLRFQLAPDFKVLADLVEDGYLIAPTIDEATFAPWWRAMLLEHARLAGRRIPPSWYLPAAARAGVPIIKQLPPEAPYPPQWYTDEPGTTAPVEQLVGATGVEVVQTPGQPSAPEATAPPAPAPAPTPAPASGPPFNIPKTYQRPAGY
jgi:hypothetical protein